VVLAAAVGSALLTMVAATAASATPPGALWQTNLTVAAPSVATSAGAVAWGANGLGELGDGTAVASEPPVQVRGLPQVSALAAGTSDSLALLSGGAVMSWGGNLDGRLGDGTTRGPETCGEAPCSTFPVTVKGLGEVTAISAGGEFSLALLKDGTVMAWGSNQFGQLGDGSSDSSSVPVKVSNLSGVIAIAAGLHHSLALLQNGTVVAWGENSDGALGDGTFSGPEQCGEASCSRIPVAVNGLAEVTALAAGGEFSLALLSNGTVKAFGDNQFGELGITGTENTDVPTAVFKLGEVSAIAAGDSYSLALLKQGTVMAWGNNTYGELGDHRTGFFDDVPVQVSNLSEVTSISAGADSGVALLKNGNVMTWGGNQFGQLGSAGPEASEVPVPVPNLSGVSAIAASGYHDLAFGVLANTVPSVTGVSPSNGPDAGGTRVTITGTNLTGASAVKFGSANAASFTVSSETSITAISPPGAGTVDVTVTTPSGTSAKTPQDHFSYGPATKGDPEASPGRSTHAPTVTNLNPSSGPAAGGTSVTITGTNLTGATAVNFGSANATSFTVVSATSIVAVSPPGAGTVCVTVTTPRGQSAPSAADHFRYGPTVNKLEPSTGSVTGGSQVTITGTGFDGATAVRFGAISAASFTVNSETSITTIPPPAEHRVDVTVSTPAGVSPQSKADQFTYNAPWEHPLVYVNSERASNHSKVPFFGWGAMALSNRVLGTLRCTSLLFGVAMNETEAAGGFDRAYGEVLSWSSSASINSAAREPSARCTSSTLPEAWAVAERPAHLATASATVNGTERLVVEGRLGGTGSHREPPSLPWRQEAYGEQTAGSERRFFLRTGIATTEKSEVEAEEAAAGTPTERRSGCYRTPAVTEIVHEPGFASARETELALRPAPKGCISVTVVAPGDGLEVPFQGTLEPVLVRGQTPLAPSHGEFRGGFIGSEGEAPSERSSERNERYLSSVFGPGYTKSEIPIKAVGFGEVELLDVH
jgi:alpha-tubulin suppressor-like RCC1 family protein